MRSPIVLIALGLVASTAKAQQPDWNQVEALTVTLSSFDFAPSTIHLRAGQPVTLHLVNAGKGGHNFSAPEFFAGASIRTEDQGFIYKGAVELRGQQAKDIHLIPRAGRYKLRCTHTMHTMLGMKGEIVVD